MKFKRDRLIELSSDRIKDKKFCTSLQIWTGKKIDMVKHESLITYHELRVLGCEIRVVKYELKA